MFGLPTDRTIALFSQSVFTPDEAARELWALNRTGVPVAELRGRYKGQDEPAFAASLWHMAAVGARGFLTDQETVLLVEPDGTAWLRPASLFPITRAAGRGNRDTLLGAFKRITEAEAMRADGFTFDPQENAYWGIDTEAPMREAIPSTETGDQNHVRT